MARFKKQVWQLLKGSMQGLFRWLFRYQRQQRRLSRSGFVFPTTMMLLLVVALTAGALTYRASTRSTAAILARQQQVIENAASPAIDRAKAKIEYLFGNDTRSPRRVPTSDQLRLMLLGSKSDPGVEIVGEPLKDNNKDIYTLDDETRVDLDGDGDITNDNAWEFSTGVGNQKVIYSITIDDATATADLDDEVTLAKAQAGVTRNGPISTIETSSSCGGGGQRSEEGWQVVSRSRVQKNVQINAYLADPNDISGTATTLELQQVREGDRSSKWGAWFRYDLELSAGVNFNWNGATHTQGSLLMGERQSNVDVTSYMISSQDSCLYGPGASDMTVGRDISNNGFHGQFVMFRNSPIIHTENADGTLNTSNVLGEGSDSISTPTGSGLDKYEAVLLDPVKMYLADVSEHIGSGWTSTAGNNPISLLGGRVKEVDEKLLKNLSLDDIFRADNRWGPKATYGTQVNKIEIPASTNIGASITDQAALTRDGDGLDGYWERQAVNSGTRFIVGERLELGNFFGWNHNPINPTGGNPIAPATHDGFDSLYPANNLPRHTAATDAGGIRNDGRFSYAEQKQRKTLRDNLAAVQGMVAYRWDMGSGISPQACIAVTAHHGTLKSVADSRTFNKFTDSAGDTMPFTNFLTGEGTDGWEFEMPDPTSTEMKKALKNLAYFAGDPKGGAPSFEPIQDSNVHPYPYMSMWGDYGVLRRIVDAGGLDSYSSLSPADRSAIDTAACTMGLLAYNLDLLKKNNEALPKEAGNATWPDLGNAFTSTAQQVKNNATKRLVLPDGSSKPFESWVAELNNSSGQYTGMLLLANTFNTYQGMLGDRMYGFLNTTAGTSSQMAYSGGQYWKHPTDSTKDGKYDAVAGTYTTSAGNGAGVPGGIAGSLYDPLTAYKVGCDPNNFSDAKFAKNGVDGVTSEADALSLALAMCTKTTTRYPKYPSLFYLFPVTAHKQDGAGTTADAVAIPAGTYSGVSIPAHTIDLKAAFASQNEPYIAQTVTAYGENNTFEPLSDTEIAAIAAKPRALDGSDWVLPVATSGATALFETNPANWPTGTTDDAGEEFRITVSKYDTAVAAGISFDSALNVSLLDKIIYSGRENMAIRVLDLDVAKLMANDWFYGKESGTDGVEHFGLTYAFREDAVREDEIVRPSSGGGTGCDTYAVLKAYDSANAGCYMAITGDSLTSTDPPLSDHKISVKPVDYAPDPDRRPYGFRLRNGRDFGRASDEQSGITFITDDTLIVQGDFNLHKDSSNNILEEFTAPPTMRSITVTPAQFYKTGRPGANLNLTNFANSANDSWRPAELVADAIYIQSDNFKDGFVSTAYVRDELGVATNANEGHVSFENANILGQSSNTNYTRPLSTRTAPYNDVVWREDGRNGNSQSDGIPTSPDALTDAAKRAPVYFDRNGVAWYRRDSSRDDRRIIPVADHNEPTAATASEYYYHGFKSDDSGGWRTVRTNNLQLADDTSVNALLVSGVTPMRFVNGREQFYGALSNFPRFNESWEVPGNSTTAASNRNLFISGAFYQLFLSHTATAPYESSTWDVQDAISSGSWYFYYQPPSRIWGYDVALQYSPPHPVTSRFVSVGNARSEFYRELPVNDPYIQVLRCAKDAGGQLVLNDPNANCS